MVNGNCHTEQNDVNTNGNKDDSDPLDKLAKNKSGSASNGGFFALISANIKWVAVAVVIAGAAAYVTYFRHKSASSPDQYQQQKYTASQQQPYSPQSQFLQYPAHMQQYQQPYQQPYPLYQQPYPRSQKPYPLQKQLAPRAPNSQYQQRQSVSIAPNLHHPQSTVPKVNG